MHAITTLGAGAVAFAFLATYGGAVWLFNSIKHARARQAARCFLAGE